MSSNFCTGVPFYQGRVGSISAANAKTFSIQDTKKKYLEYSQSNRPTKRK